MLGWWRRPAVMRTIALLFLFWAGVDLGMHSFFGSDSSKVFVSHGSVDGGMTPRDAGAESAADQCFCHGLSTGAVVAEPTEGLAPVDTVSPALSPQVPRSSSRPLDRPPDIGL